MSKSLEARERYDYYAVGLCFAVLGASIQTVKFNPDQKVAGLLEIASWVCFIIAIFKGLLQLKTYSMHFRIFELQQRNSEKVDAIRELASTNSKLARKAAEVGDVVSEFTVEKVSDDIAKLSDELKASDKESKSLISELEGLGTDTYSRWMINAIGLLAMSRTHEPIKTILNGFHQK